MKWKKGSSELIAFLLIIPILLAIAFNPLLMYIDTEKYSQIDDIAKKYILIMETEGGMTSTAYTNLLNELSNKTYLKNIQVNYTPYPVSYGSEVKLKITGDISTSRINIIGGLKNETIRIECGEYTSISKKVTSP